MNVKTSIQGSTKQSAFLKALIFIVYTGNINFPFFLLLRSALEYGQVFLALEQDQTWQSFFLKQVFIWISSSRNGNIRNIQLQTYHTILLQIGDVSYPVLEDVIDYQLSPLIDPLKMEQQVNIRIVIWYIFVLQKC